MQFAGNIRWDEKIEKPLIVLKQLKKGEVPKNIFLICQTSSGKTEIMSCGQALKPINKPSQLTVIAAAAGKERAFDLLADMYGDGTLHH